MSQGLRRLSMRVVQLVCIASLGKAAGSDQHLWSHPFSPAKAQTTSKRTATDLTISPCKLVYICYDCASRACLRLCAAKNRRRLDCCSDLRLVLVCDAVGVIWKRVCKSWTTIESDAHSAHYIVACSGFGQTHRIIRGAHDRQKLARLGR